MELLCITRGFEAIFGGDVEAEVLWKQLKINFVFSDKNYSAFFKSFAFKYYVVCGYCMPYEYVQLQRVMVNRIVLRVVTESIAVCWLKRITVELLVAILWKERRN